MLVNLSKMYNVHKLSTDNSLHMRVNSPTTNNFPKLTTYNSLDHFLLGHIYNRTGSNLCISAYAHVDVFVEKPCFLK